MVWFPWTQLSGEAGLFMPCIRARLMNMLTQCKSAPCSCCLLTLAFARPIWTQAGTPYMSLDMHQLSIMSISVGNAVSHGYRQHPINVTMSCAMEYGKLACRMRGLYPVILQHLNGDVPGCCLLLMWHAIPACGCMPFLTVVYIEHVSWS